VHQRPARRRRDAPRPPGRRGQGTLHYHGDFGWGGLRIANVLHDGVPFTPWRYDTAPYLAAGDVGCPLTPAMSRANRRIEEELVLDDPLDDLSA
jgi:hypothetical protein